MTLEKILESFSIETLEQLASNKIMDVGNIRLPREVLIEELINHINKFTYINQAIYLRTPPCHQILGELLAAPKYKQPVKGFKAKVLAEKAKLEKMAISQEGLKRKEDYDLYLKMLQTAWESESRIDNSEAALLKTLREELGISFKEHMILEHDESLVGYWHTDDKFFERERNYLISAGIIFPVDDSYVVPENLIKHIRKAWGFALTNEQYVRLFSSLSNTELEEILVKLELAVSGASQQKIERLLDNYVTPAKAFENLGTENLRALARKTGSPISGSKEDVILNLIDFFEDDEDLRQLAVEQKKREPDPIEEKVLSEENFRTLFSLLSGEQLYNIASSFKGVRKSGNKERKVQNLFESHLNETSLLNSLTNGELYELCDCTGCKVSGNKGDKIQRLLVVELKQTEVISSDEEEKSPEELIKISTRNTNPVDELRKNSEELFREIQDKFSYLDENEQTVVVWLWELKSVNENEFERLLARYNIPWYFSRTQMEKLVEKLKENGKPLIQIKHIADHCIYELTGAEL